MAIYGTLADSISFGSVNPADISATIGTSATDIFVYDTRNDSDGGAWRKRTTHTSWYNETLNTSTRGSRREFPIVAILVVDDNLGNLTIYDGDDPDFPMWMVFNNGTGRDYLYGCGTIKNIAMKNAAFITGSTANNFWPVYVDFLRDDCLGLRNQVNGHMRHGYPISGRNTTDSDSNIVWRSQYLLPAWYIEEGILDQEIDYVAMDVLPNSPVDPATGISRPTILLGGPDGACLIKHDGVVRNLVQSTTANTEFVGFVNSEFCYFSHDTSGGTTNKWTAFVEIDPPAPTGTADISPGYNDETYTWYSNYAITGNTNILVATPVRASNNIPYTAITSGGNRMHFGSAAGAGIQATSLDRSRYSTFLTQKRMLAHVTPEYNTGYMVGDIRACWLCESDTSTIDGTNQVTNGDFGTGDFTGWTTAGQTTPTISNGGALLTTGSPDGQITQTGIGLGVGNYIISWEIVSNNGGDWGFFLNGGGEYVHGSSPGIYTYQIDNSTIDTISFRHRVTSFGVIDNIAIHRSIPDRSYRNRAIECRGDISRTPIVPGSDIVAYSGFNANSYLFQTYNNILEPFNNDPFFIMAWIKGNSGCVWMKRSGSGSEDWRCEFLANGIPRFIMSANGNVADAQADITFNTEEWHHMTWVKTGARTVEQYIDGRLAASATAGGDISLTEGDAFAIGNRSDLVASEPFNGSISMFRITKDLIQAEQIKQIYEEEKALFVEGAQATLHGSATTITAMEYDDGTDILHIGTASGRSDFQGLVRINNTTDAITTKISASNGFILEQ